VKSNATNGFGTDFVKILSFKIPHIFNFGLPLNLSFDARI